MTTENKPEIRTNNHNRPLISWTDLTEAEQKDFDYFDDPENETGYDFFRFKGRVYTTGDFMRIDQNNTAFPGWHGYSGDSFFSGVLIKLSDCGETVIVGRYFS